MSPARYTRRTAPAERMAYANWIWPDVSALPPLQRRRVAVLADAIRLYIDGHSIRNFLDANDVARETFLRAFNRCLALDGKGRQFGWQALIRNLRVRTPRRTAPLVQRGRWGRGGLSGAFWLTLKTYPEIQRQLNHYLLKTAKRAEGYESRVRHKSAHQKFLQLCTEAGIGATDWPFTTKKEGRGAVYQYVARFLHSRYDDIVMTQYGDRARAKANTGTGEHSRLVAARPYDIVEIDEHRCHFIGAFGVETPEGVRWVPVNRITIIVAVDRYLDVIFGYKAIFRSEACAGDLLDVLNGICGVRSEHVFMEGMRYTPGSGFAGDLGAAFSWCGCNQILLDGALIHLAHEVIDRAGDLLGCDFNFGPIGRPERRHMIERVFAEFERAGFHRVATTTGSHPRDPKRQDPEATASEGRMLLREALDLIEAVLADKNGKKGKANFGAAPLNRLSAYGAGGEREHLFIPALPPLAPGMARLDQAIVTHTVRGNKESGRRPYVAMGEEDYVGADLADRWDLIGQQVRGHYPRCDTRRQMLYTLDGQHIGEVSVRGRWRHSPHTLDERASINALIRDGYLHVGYDEDPVHIHHEAVKARLARERRVSAETRKGLSRIAEHTQHAQERARAAAASELTQILQDEAARHAPAPSSTASVIAEPPVDEAFLDDLLADDALRSFNGDSP